MKITFELIDLLVISVYFVSVLSVGFFISLKNRNSSDDKTEYLLAGRKLTTPFFVATLVATWYGNILGVGEFVYNNGIVAWVCFGLAYYFAAIFYSLYLSKKVRTSGFFSIPEQISHFYGNKSGWISAVIVMIISVPAAYILMIGILIQLITGWSLLTCLILGSFLSTIYLFTGGLKADVYTNVLQFIMMYLGFGILLIFCIINFGVVDFGTVLPANHLSLTGGFHWQYLLSWFFIALQTLVDPSFHQRSAAAKTPGVAKKGILISVLFWFIFDMLTLFTGLYARYALPNINAVLTYPYLSQKILPPFFKGIFFVAMVSPVISALGGYTFVSAYTFGNQILLKLLKGNRWSDKLLTRIGIIFSVITGIIIAYFIPSPVDIIFKTASVAVPGLIAPLVISFLSNYKLSTKGSLIIMISSTSISAFWLFLKETSFLGSIPLNYYFGNTEPMLIGILVSAILSIIFIRKNKLS